MVRPVCVWQCLWGLLGSSSTLADIAYGENYNKSSGELIQTVRGPLLYWTATLQGDRER